MAGEQLVGAKQNRVLNVSLMVPPSTTLDIPVSCVEAGRWQRRSAKFASGGSMSHGKLRKMMSKQTHLGHRSGGSPTSDQMAVWDEVSRKLSAMGSVSPSQAFDQVHQDYAARLDDLSSRLHPPDGCHGVIFAVAGQIEGADLFDQPATLAKLWTKLARAYALDAMETAASEAPPITTDDASRWIQAAAGREDRVVSVPGDRPRCPARGHRPVRLRPGRRRAGRASRAVLRVADAPYLITNGEHVCYQVTGRLRRAPQLTGR